MVCDVARPRNVSRRVADRAQTMCSSSKAAFVDVSGERGLSALTLAFRPAKPTPAWQRPCSWPWKERYECFTIGKEISLDRVDEIAELAAKHGFRLSGFRSFERAVTNDRDQRQLEQITSDAQTASSTVWR